MNSQLTVFALQMIALLGLCSVIAFGAGRLLVILGASEPKPFGTSPRAWVGLVLTVLLSVCWLVAEIGAAASSRANEGLGVFGFPLYWASVFAPWMLLRYWGEPVLGLTRSRVALLTLMVGGGMGWLGRSYLA